MSRFRNFARGLLLRHEGSGTAMNTAESEHGTANSHDITFDDGDSQLTAGSIDNETMVVPSPTILNDEVEGESLEHGGDGQGTATDQGNTDDGAAVESMQDGGYEDSDLDEISDDETDLVLAGPRENPLKEHMDEADQRRDQDLDGVLPTSCERNNPSCGSYMVCEKMTSWMKKMEINPRRELLLAVQDLSIAATNINAAHDESKVISDEMKALNAQKSIERLTNDHHVTTNISYATGLKSTSSVFCCSACGTVLFRPTNLLQERDRAVEVLIDDCKTTLPVDQIDCYEDETRVMNNDEDWAYKVCNVRCPEPTCRLFIGIKVKSSTAQPPAPELPHGNLSDLLAHLFSACRSISISAPNREWLRGTQEKDLRRASSTSTEYSSLGRHSLPTPRDSMIDERQSEGRQSEERSSTESYESTFSSSSRSLSLLLTAAANFSDASRRLSCDLLSRDSQVLPTTEDEVGIDQTYICSRYLKLATIKTGKRMKRKLKTKASIKLLHCASCRRVLSTSDQILCCNRRWGFGDGASEPACYMNSLCSGQYVVRNVFEQHLSQGLFDMADVYCACGKQVGYKFICDKSATNRNVQQPGRFGLVASCIEVGDNVSAVLGSRNAASSVALPNSVTAGAR